MNRRAFLKMAGCGVGGLMLPGCAFGAAKKFLDGRRPNILLITTDQQRIDAMSAVGNTWVKTPHMDSIAAHGVCFQKSYCSYPLCSPSRSCLHTGRTPHEIGVDRNSLPIDPAVIISGQVFKDAGYDTGYSGKWHMPDPYPADGIAGFEVLNKVERTRRLAKDVDEATMNQAIEFLKRRRDKPFYLVVSFINPHDICLLAGEDSPILNDVMGRYMPGDGVALPPLPANLPMPAGASDILPARKRHEQWDETHWRRYRYAYYRMMEDVDRQVGQVLAALRAIGQEDKTLIVFTSDHGEGLACHRWTGKMMYFDDEAAVPLIVSGKGITPAGRMDKEHLVSTLDVLPTICDYAGLKPPGKMRGESLRAAIERPTEPGHEYVVSEMAGSGGARSFMVRTRNYKYMVFPGSTSAEMFFDMEADPGEMNNIAGKKELAGELERHRTLLARWKELTEEARYPVKPAAGKGKGRRKNKKQSVKGGINEQT